MSPEIGLLLGADTLLTRGRLHWRRWYGEVATDLAGSKTPGMHGNTLRGTREALHLAWGSRVSSAWGTHMGCAQVQGVGQPHSIDRALEQRLWCARVGGGYGEKGAGYGEPGRAP